LRRRLLSGHIAYARSVEFTRSHDGKAHPHLHSLLVLPGGNAGVSQSSLMHAWKEACDLSYEPWVSVQSIPFRDAVRCMGYISKPSVCIDRAILRDSGFALEITHQLRGQRLFSAGGEIVRIKRQIQKGDEEYHAEPADRYACEYRWSATDAEYHRVSIPDFATTIHVNNLHQTSGFESEPDDDMPQPCPTMRQ
jgi:hypothetical protein